MRSLFSMIGKDMKIFFRSPVSAIFIILLPFLIILLAGFVFNSSGLSGVVVGTYSPLDSSLTNEIINGFSEQNFAVHEYDSAENCINSVKLSRTQICVVFPGDLSKEGSVNDIVFHVDHSRLNLAYALIQDVEVRINAKSSDLGVAMTQNLIDSLKNVRSSLPNSRAGISSSVQNLNDVSSSLESTSLASEIEDTIDKLNDARTLSDNEEVNSKISSAISDLNTLRDFSATLDEVQTSNTETLTLLNSVSSNLDSLITSLNNVNNLDAERIVSPITTSIESVNVSSNNRDYMLPTLLSIIILFGGILLSATLVLKEKKTRAYFRNFMTPSRDLTFIVSSALSCLIILILQFVLVFLGILFILRVPLSGMYWDVLLVVFSGLLGFIFLGMFLAYLFKSEETVIFASVLVATVLMFLSNTVLPIETITGNFAQFASFNPVVVLDLALKKIILFGFPFKNLVNEFYVLGGFFVVFAVLTYVFRKISRRRL